MNGKLRLIKARGLLKVAIMSRKTSEYRLKKIKGSGKRDNKRDDDDEISVSE